MHPGAINRSADRAILAPHEKAEPDLSRARIVRPNATPDVEPQIQVLQRGVVGAVHLGDRCRRRIFGSARLDGSSNQGVTMKALRAMISRPAGPTSLLNMGRGAMRPVQGRARVPNPLAPAPSL